MATFHALTAAGAVRFAGVLAICVAAAGVQARAQEAANESGPGPLERVGMTGSVRGGYWSSTRNLDSEDHVGAGMVWIKATRQISPRVSFLAEGWTALRGPLGDGDITGEMREAFVDLRFGRLDFRVGRQIIAWGRADGVNPTDTVTGEDLTLLAPDDDDRRRGTTAVRATYYVGGLSMTGLWAPEFRGHQFPLPAAPAGLTFVLDRPEWPGNQWAVRIEHTGAAVDWSVSHFRGFDLLPDLGLREVPNRPTSIRLSHHRIRLFGGDLAANLGRFGVRMEGAYVDSDDANGPDRYTKKPFVFVVAGGDRTFREHLNVNVQYLYRLVVDFNGVEGTGSSFEIAVARTQATLNSQTERLQHGASLRIAYRWLRDTLEGECAAAGYFKPKGLTVRPKMAYAVSDDWKVAIGGELFRGESSALFGLLRPNSTVYFEARWSF